MKKILFMFAAALMMIACNNEEIVTNDDVQYVSELKLNFGKGDSRVTATHSDAGLKFAWENGDQIEIYEEGKNVTHRYTYNGESFVADHESYRMQVGKKYFAVRETYSTGVNPDTKDVLMRVETDGKCGLPYIPLISDVFDAKLDGTIATMHHLVGVVEIPVKKSEGFNKTITQFNIYVSGKCLGGTFTANPTLDGYITNIPDGFAYAFSEEKTNYNLSTTATTVFIPVLPGTYENAKLNYFYAEGSGQCSIGNITVERGKITKLNEVILE